MPPVVHLVLEDSVDELAFIKNPHNALFCAVFGDPDNAAELLRSRLACLRYVDAEGAASEVYPLNPNGSELGLNGFSNEDGRFTILMPHPERIFRSLQHSWSPLEWGEDGPWMRLFRNARRWIG